jgi:hypothetical protein
MGPCDSVHLRADPVKERHTVVPRRVEIKMRSAGQIREVRVTAESLEDVLKSMCSAVKIKRVGRSYDDMDPPV